MKVGSCGLTFEFLTVLTYVYMQIFLFLYDRTADTSRASPPSHRDFRFLRFGTGLDFSCAQTRART